MGGISENKVGGIALLLGPVLATVFFLLQPTGLLIDRVEVGNPEEAIRTYAAKPESTEGGRWVSVLKRPKGAPLNLG